MLVQKIDRCQVSAIADRSKPLQRISAIKGIVQSTEFLPILLKKSAIKKSYYLLTFLAFSWYILDNGSGNINFKIVTTPII